MDAVKLARLQFIIDNAINKRKETWELIQQQKLLQFERSYLEAVMWLSVGIEWFEKNAKHCLYTDFDLVANIKISEISKEDLREEYYYLLGIKQIFNSFKHNMEITSFEKENYDDTLLGIPIQRVLWVNSEQMEVRLELQFESFKENFENKEIIETLLYAHKKLDSLKKAYLNELSELASKK